MIEIIYPANWELVKDQCVDVIFKLDNKKYIGSFISLKEVQRIIASRKGYYKSAIIVESCTSESILSAIKSLLSGDDFDFLFSEI